MVQLQKKMPKALKGGKREARLKVVDLFAGAGGLSCGLEMAGFETQFACEIEPVYANTYKHNHQNIPVHVDDVRGLDGKAILEATGLKKGELDLLAGGPPVTLIAKWL